MEVIQTFPVIGQTQVRAPENFITDFRISPSTQESFSSQNATAENFAVTTGDTTGTGDRDTDNNPPATASPEIKPRKLSARAAADLKLVEAAKGGCQQSFEKLLNRYRHSVYCKMYSMVNNNLDAEDLTSEAFSKAFHKLPTYVPHHAFSTWLHRIAKNNCIDFIRKKRIQTLSIDEPVEKGSECDFSNNLKAEMLNPEERMVREQRQELVRLVVDKLDVKYRRMIELRYFKELAYDEIADKLSIPLGTVKAQLFRAKDLMYDLIIDTGAASYMEDTRRHAKMKITKAVA